MDPAIIFMLVAAVHGMIGVTTAVLVVYVMLDTLNGLDTKVLIFEPLRSCVRCVMYNAL